MEVLTQKSLVINWGVRNARIAVSKYAIDISHVSSQEQLTL
jgi:hypothetical protein